MRILIVEDSASDMATAVEIIRTAGHEAIEATNALEGVNELQPRVGSPKIDGVITDLFMPDGAPDLDELSGIGVADQPRGLSVALRAEQLGIPFIICTAGYHHGTKYNWICQLGRQRSWPEMVDSATDRDDLFTTEGPSKDWQKALDILTKRLRS